MCRQMKAFMQAKLESRLNSHDGGKPNWNRPESCEPNRWNDFCEPERRELEACPELGSGLAGIKCVRTELLRPPIQISRRDVYDGHGFERRCFLNDVFDTCWDFLLFIICLLSRCEPEELGL